jgi:hypothetical protein
MTTNGDRSRVAYILALAVGTVLVIVAFTALLAVVWGHRTLGENTARFFTIILGSVIGALAAYIGVTRKSGKSNGTST